MTSLALKQFNVIKGQDALLEYHEINESYNPETDYICLDIETYMAEKNEFGGLIPHLSKIKSVQVLVFSLENGKMFQKGCWVFIPKGSPINNFAEFIDKVLKGKRIVGHNIVFDLAHIFYNARQKISLSKEYFQLYDTRYIWMKNFANFKLDKSDIYNQHGKLKTSLKDLYSLFGMGKIDKSVRDSIFMSEEMTHEEIIYAAQDVIYTAELFAKMLEVSHYDEHVDAVIRHLVNISIGNFEKTCIKNIVYHKDQGFRIETTSEEKNNSELTRYLTLRQQGPISFIESDVQNILYPNSSLLKLSSKSIIDIDNIYVYFVERNRFNLLSLLNNSKILFKYIAVKLKSFIKKTKRLFRTNLYKSI